MRLLRQVSGWPCSSWQRLGHRPKQVHDWAATYLQTPAMSVARRLLLARALVATPASPRAHGQARVF
jgi:hypothetical protein